MGIVILRDWGDVYIFDPNTRKITTCGWDVGRWATEDLLYIEEATEALKRKLGGPSKIRAAVGQAIVNKIDINKSMMSPPGISSYFLGDIVVLSTGNALDKAWFEFNFVHEFGHVWDYRSGNQLSFNLMIRLGTWFCMPTVSCAWLPSLATEPPPDTCRDPNNRQCTEPPPYPYSSSYGNFPILTAPGAEDWANSLGYYVFPNYRQPFVMGLGSERRKYVKEQIANLP
ncbi:MAG: hypothetical protein NTW32_27245 [Chloroflexi bacterium]|nr:hypothetical protein [Chloroflexota bacterium]